VESVEDELRDKQEEC